MDPRRRNERGIYREARIGLADDLQDANGDSVLDFSQAQRNARTWWTHEQRHGSGLRTTSTEPYTVARAMADYLEDYRRRSGKASDSVESQFVGISFPSSETLMFLRLARSYC